MSGEHEDGRVGGGASQPHEPVEALRVGQAEVQQGAVGAGHLQLGVGERRDRDDLDLGGDVGQQLADEEGIALVVFDEQHARRLVDR